MSVRQPVKQIHHLRLVLPKAEVWLLNDILLPELEFRLLCNASEFELVLLLFICLLLNWSVMVLREYEAH